MSPNPRALSTAFDDVWLLDGVRTPFADYMGAFAEVSPIDLGIKAARAVLKKADVPAEDVGAVVAGNMAQASYDAYMLPRHVGLYAGVPVDVLFWPQDHQPALPHEYQFDLDTAEGREALRRIEAFLAGLN